MPPRRNGKKENIGLSLENATRDAESMILKKRPVIDGDYAILQQEGQKKGEHLEQKKGEYLPGTRQWSLVTPPDLIVPIAPCGPVLAAHLPAKDMLVHIHVGIA